MPSRPVFSWFGPFSLLVLVGAFVFSGASRAEEAAATGTQPGNVWIQNGFAQTRFVISGTGGRNNPLRRSVSPPRSEDELFVRFRLRYEAESLDAPGEDSSGEFFVLWLDQEEGGNGSTHAGNVPNIGLHVADQRNRFMVRFNSNKQAFGPELEGDRDFLVVGRVWKSLPGKEQPFDKLDLWVDPRADAEYSPQASTSTRGTLRSISWLGFSTGAKTEFDDLIHVWDVALADSWREILNLPEQAPEAEAAPQSPAEPTVAFVDDIHPILQTHCFRCHAGEDPESEVRLDVWDEVLNQTKPFHADESRLIQIIRDGEMPPDADPLTDAEVDSLATWINEGVQWDEALLPTPIPETQHPSFSSVQRPDIPRVENAEWIRTPVDAFIAARQESQGIHPNPPADAETLARRMSLDMLGLPPSDSTITADDVANQTAIDRLLSHPGYGVRWGRHWLDVARWAESNGHQHNRDRVHAWRYRDWVVEAFNTNQPFDHFVRQQVAGDLMRPFDPSQVIATGFLAAARYSGNELDKNIQRNDILVDVANVTAEAFMGLTFQCAQCHTHKFDPITIRDYYRFQAFFADAQPHNVALDSDDPQLRDWVNQRWDLFDSVHQRLLTIKRKQGHPEPIYITPKSVIGGMKADERKRFNELEKRIGQVNQAWAFVRSQGGDDAWLVTPHEMRWPLPRLAGRPAMEQSHLLLRGDVYSKGPAVEPGWPSVFGPAAPKDQLTRLDLADWFVDRTHPLTARVWANRVWQWHFGRGLVETSSDFGTQGTPASHPELLDYLAVELIDSGWDTAHLHRLILNSATYRQSHGHSAENAGIDPDNRRWWRWEPRRLEAEAIRDSLLAVSDRLDGAMGGPSVSHRSPRRALYLEQKRDALSEQQILFDSANGISSCSRRRVSTNGLQPLWLMNDEFAQRAAEGLAERAGDVATAITLALGRDPNEGELRTLQALAERHGMASACLVILNSSEFVYIP